MTDTNSTQSKLDKLKKIESKRGDIASKKMNWSIALFAGIGLTASASVNFINTTFDVNHIKKTKSLTPEALNKKFRSQYVHEVIERLDNSLTASFRQHLETKPDRPFVIQKEIDRISDTAQKNTEKCVEQKKEELPQKLDSIKYEQKSFGQLSLFFAIASFGAYKRRQYLKNEYEALEKSLKPLDI